MVRVALYWLLIFLVAPSNKGLAEAPGNERSAALSEFLNLIVARQPQIEARAKRLVKLLEIAVFDSRADPDVAKRLESGLKAVQYAVRTDESTLPTLQSGEFLRVTLVVDPSRLATEIDSIINFCFERGFTDDFGAGLGNIINIMSDPNGPSKALGNELVPLLGRKWVLIHNPTAREFQWLVAISHEDKQGMIELLMPLLLNEPDAHRIMDNHYSTKYAALSVVNDWLLIGSPEFVDTATVALQ